MEIVKPKIIVILGPTASGKSDAAIKIAQKYNGEIISADSRQVYRGMNIGTGKVMRDIVTGNSSLVTDNDNVFLSEGIIHHLIDVAEPNEDFNISHFKTQANLAIEDILSRGKLPIICGGTGFWIQAITEDMNLPEVPPNEKLRQELELKTPEELFEKLKKLDPERAETIDFQNKYRLIRALEICQAIGKVPNQSSVISNQSSKYDFLQIGISIEKEKLHERIKNRLESRFDEGMIEEVKSLNENGISWEKLESFGLEYRWLARFLQGKISKEEMNEKLYFDIIHYAKRQMTWFKRNKKIVWLENYKDIESEVEKFIEK
ncbi:MAG: tRNA dimethylallyltransferase [Candidatus Moranbacteria bacterium GW2011_GWC2_37_8]|nr:MAG: tRNA dimethylallyltransferase [Candidatus Moranbacteria bacterium GW2011_GWC2_37_8]KKQ63378.1 MAG: tRNA dimethylallyltransferase [Parcubacteria group bacterium GW2011_GWC1_38_22]KKQ80971.1 MAG: tRNA dimethylallyltransferase [Candidatus Moranbacteria bacterium GW2011_GWD2_38_7]